MKLKTAIKIEKAVPYGLSVLAGAVTFAVMRLYGQHCEEIGYDAGTDGTIDTINKHSPGLLDEFLDNTNPPTKFDD